MTEKINLGCKCMLLWLLHGADLAGEAVCVRVLVCG